MTQEHVYQAKTVWTGASYSSTSSYESYSREYTVIIEGKPRVVGSADPTFYGDSSLHNPEDLLVIALSTCHMLSYLALCGAGVRVISYSDEARGKMAHQEGKIRFTEVVLHPKVVIAAGDNLLKAESLHHDAHEVCFIANSVSFPVLHQPLVLDSNNPQAN